MKRVWYVQGDIVTVYLVYVQKYAKISRYWVSRKDLGRAAVYQERAGGLPQLGVVYR